MDEIREKRGFQLKSRYLVGILGIAVGIYGIMTAIDKRNKRKKIESTIQQWSDQQRQIDPATRVDTIKLN